MKRLSRIFTALLLVAAFSLPLLSCGKKVSLDPPPGNEYPRKYPSE
ncbi:MAG: hypothetical protein HOO00_05035 [Rhodospirillaceae bacterium]|nr:hypothetical protein [Rhodospirillaceae bacterium]